MSVSFSNENPNKLYGTLVYRFNKCNRRSYNSQTRRFDTPVQCLHALSNVYQTDVWSVRCILCHSHCKEYNKWRRFFVLSRILRFGKNMPQSLKRFLSNFNVVAIQNSLDGFRNTLNVRNNNKTSRCFPLISVECYQL